MKVRHTLVAAGLAAAGLLASPAFAQIKIGFMAELSGPQGALGQDQYDAFMMVVEANGGKLGGEGIVTFLQHCAAENAAALVHPWDMMAAERTGELWAI